MRDPVLPPTAAVLRAMDPDRELPDGLWRAGVDLPDEVRKELARVLAHCLIRDEVERAKVVAANADTVRYLCMAVHLWVSRGALSVRTANVLYNADLRCMADVWAFHDSDLLRLKNLGRKCLNEIKALRHSIGTVTDAELREALAKRPTREEAHLALINRRESSDG